MAKDIYVQWGEADSFWDASLPKSAYRDVPFTKEDLSSLSVYVDPNTGAVELNAGYDPDSSIGRAERELFDGNVEDIEAALLKVVRHDDPLNAAFVARMESGSAPRP